MQTQTMIEKRNKVYLYELCVLGFLLTSAGGMQVFQAITSHSHHSFLDFRPVASDSVMLTVTYRSCNKVSFSLRRGNIFVEIVVTHDRLNAYLHLLKPRQPLSAVHPEKEAGVSHSRELITAFGNGFSCDKDRTVVVVWKKSGFQEMSVFMQPSMVKSSPFFVRAFKGDVEAIHVESSRSRATWNLSIGVPEINQYLTSAVETAGRVFDRHVYPSSSQELVYYPSLAFDSATLIVTVSYRSCKSLYIDITAGVSLLRLKVVPDQLIVEYWDPQRKLPLKKLNTLPRTVKYGTATSCTSDRFWTHDSKCTQPGNRCVLVWSNAQLSRVNVVSLVIAWNRLYSREMTVTMQPPILIYDVFIVPGFFFHPRTIDLFPHGGSPVNWTVSVAELDMK